ncbi:MAG: DUF1016 N-terminal domain-containing protein [Polyangiaceae bacterium]|nr:DUF1016 N-terminal domain-containing protein [Polyangiaceae bacterium]
MPQSVILNREAYSSLLKDLQKLISQSKKKPADNKISAYWAIGQRIASSKLSRSAGYGQAIMKDLAQDTKLAPRTLYDTVQFFEAHSSPPLNDSVTWSHHRLLARLPTKKARKFYEQKLKKEKWSAAQLSRAIAQELHDSKTPASVLLKRPTHPEYLYRASLLSVIDGDTLDLDIDLGFDVRRRLRARLADVNAPELSARGGRAARNFLIEQLSRANTIAVQTRRVDLHGRYVVHLFYLAGSASLTSVFKKGTYLNDQLVQAKVAAVVP